MSGLVSASLIKQLSSLKNPKRLRIDVASPSLCDDIIRRLAPSLAPFVGGTIIDICPGAGLLSQKLHEHLKPREHILLEPEFKQYSRFLQPLLEEPNSAYRFRDWQDDRIWEPSEFEKEGLMPEKRHDSNNAVLQIISAPSRAGPTRSLKDHLRASDKGAYRFMHEARSQQGFHARGPTRMLMWCLEEQARTLLPKSIDFRRKNAVGLEAHTHVDEVVGFSHISRRSQREQRLNIASSELVRQRMKKRKIYTPPNREVGTIEQDDEEFSEVHRAWHEELRNLMDRFREGELSRFVGKTPEVIKSFAGRRWKEHTEPYTKEYMRTKHLISIVRGQNALLKKVRALVDEQSELDKLDMALRDPSLSTYKVKKITAELESRYANFKEGLPMQPEKTRNSFYMRADDYHAFTMPTGPLLMWDRRSYEPLTASADEFHYPKELALLDFQAKPPGTLPLTEDQSVYWDVITSGLFGSRGSWDLKHLNRVAPGAFEALVPRVPELRDPREGGRSDLDMLRARTLTPKMLWRLAIEFDDWAFKPEMQELSTTSDMLGDAGRKQRQFMIQ